PKVRVTVTVSADVLRRVDETAARVPGANRSRIIDDWLRLGAQRQAQAQLDLAIAAYYDQLTLEEREEDAAWSRASTASFFRREQRGSPARASRRRARRTPP